MYTSLRKSSVRPFRLWALCFDEETLEALRSLELEHVRTIAIEELEESDPELAATRDNRSLVEYYWTATPCLPLHLLQRRPEIQVITYLDADLFFWADPQPIFDELGTGSILIVAHRFPEDVREENEKLGIYNVGLLSFRRDRSGLAALGWWRERCLEWCYRRVEPGRFGDQKYLDDWPERFDGVRVLEHEGAGLAPWNLKKYDLELVGGRIVVSGQPLIFYHFHRLEFVAPSLMSHGVSLAQLDRLLVDLYLAYARELLASARSLPAGIRRALRPRRAGSRRRLVGGALRCRYLLVKPAWLGRALARFGLWRVQGERLARRGFALYESGARAEARFVLARAVLRSPGLAMEPRFRNAFRRRARREQATSGEPSSGREETGEEI